MVPVNAHPDDADEWGETLYLEAERISGDVDLVATLPMTDDQFDSFVIAHLREKGLDVKVINNEDLGGGEASPDRLEAEDQELILDMSRASRDAKTFVTRGELDAVVGRLAAFMGLKSRRILPSTDSSSLLLTPNTHTHIPALLAQMAQQMNRLHAQIQSMGLSWNMTLDPETQEWYWVKTGTPTVEGEVVTEEVVDAEDE
jgi:hypothetical protein